MERYAKYKDSGIAWLGEIPEHWKTVALKWLSKIYAGGTPDKNKSEYWLNGNIPWLNSGTVNQFIITEPSEYISEEGFANSSAKWIEEGSLVMALAGQGKTKGMTGFVTFRTTCNQSLAVIQPKQIIDGKFLLYFLTRNYFYIRGLAGEGKRDGLNLEIIGSLYIPLFDLEEQKTIAAFLDRKTAEIDELIAQKERLIALYEEEKTAIINEAVTKGINPDVKLKPTAIDWLGDIPEHWKVTKANYVSNIFVPQRNKPQLNDTSGIPWLTMDDMSTDRISKTLFKVADKALQDAGSKVLPKGSVIASCVGNFGVSAINDIDVIINQQLQAFIPNNQKIISEYLCNIVSISSCYFEMVATAATLPYVNQSGFASIPILLPPLEEQKAIAEYIEKETARIDAKIAKTKRIIELQKEYRTALISEAVTGKIKIPDLTELDQ